MIGLVFFAAMGAMFFGAFYLQLVRGYGPLASGALFVPFAVGQMVFAPRSAAMVKRFGPKAVSTAGLLLVARRPGRLAVHRRDHADLGRRRARSSSWASAWPT